MGKISKKCSCNSLHIYWGVEGGESRNPSYNPVIYQSWPFATKHSILTCQCLPERENYMDSSLYSSSRCGMNLKHIWNLIENLYEYPDSHSSWTPLWCASVLCQHPPSPHASDFQTCKCMVLLRVSHQEGSVCVTCLLVEFFPILQFCIAIDWLCAGWLTLIYSIFTTSNWLQVHHPLPSTLSRLLLTFTYFVMLFIVVFSSAFLFPSSVLFAPLLPLLSNLFACACLFPPVTSLLYYIMNLFFCHGLGETCTCHSLLSHWHLSAPQPLCPLFWASPHPLLLMPSAAPRRRCRWAGSEHSPWECRDLSSHLSDVQSWALPQGLLSCASHGAPDEPDERTGKS